MKSIIVYKQISIIDGEIQRYGLRFEADDNDTHVVWLTQSELEATLLAIQGALQ